MPPEARSVSLNLSSRELIFLQKVTRQEYHFITDDEQEARLRLRDKLLEGFFDQNESRIVLNLTRDELLFLIKVARENYSFIVRAEKEARLALAAKLHKTAEAVFGVSSKVEGLTTPRVRLDYTGSLRETIGRAGLTSRELAQGARAADAGRKRLRRALDAGRYGFDAVLDDRKALEAARAEGQRLARRADTLVVDGIGGSALGALALEAALRPRRKRLVILDNVDPEVVSARLASLDPERTAVNVVTKSGSTAETAANMLVLMDWMEKRLGSAYLKRWCATTDPDKGELRALATRLRLATLPVPANVGGRFSVLTAVGLLPACFLGLDVDALMQGARDMRKHCWTAPPERNAGAMGATILYLMARKRSRNIQVLMPYAGSLVPLADWYRQLWAESLGKRLDRRGRVVETGQTPVTALGATDQHSQVQLYMEGPHDKIVSFLEVEEFRPDVRIPRLLPDLATTGYLGGRTLGELLNAERRGTEIALTNAGRPSLCYRLPRIDAHTIGQLIYLFEFQTALSGELYGIDAFDQPGVEAGKVAAYALMGRAGYEKEAARLRSALSRKRAVI